MATPGDKMLASIGAATRAIASARSDDYADGIEYALSLVRRLCAENRDTLTAEQLSVFLDGYASGIGAK
jgi:hypothetical protein